MVLLPFFIAEALGESEAKKASSVLATVRRAGIVFGVFGFGYSGRGARDCASKVRILALENILFHYKIRVFSRGKKTHENTHNES